MNRNTVSGLAAAVAAAGAFFSLSLAARAGQDCCAPAAKGAAAQPVQARPDKGVQKATVVINGGYSPATVAVKAGKPVQITFVRKEANGCGNVVRFPGLNVERTLKTGEKTVVTFTPKKAGNIPFTCGMGMYRGQVVVR